MVIRGSEMRIRGLPMRVREDSVLIPGIDGVENFVFNQDGVDVGFRGVVAEQVRPQSFHPGYFGSSNLKVREVAHLNNQVSSAL
jgi:hypothetical protein